MCFAVSYDCTVSCVNGYLNVTKIEQGIVTSDGLANACYITCGSAQEAASWGSTYKTALDPTYPVLNPVICILIVMALIGIAYGCYYLWSVRKPKI